MSWGMCCVVNNEQRTCRTRCWIPRLAFYNVRWVGLMSNGIARTRAVMRALGSRRKSRPTNKSGAWHYQTRVTDWFRRLLFPPHSLGPSSPLRLVFSFSSLLFRTRQDERKYMGALLSPNFSSIFAPIQAWCEKSRDVLGDTVGLSAAILQKVDNGPETLRLFTPDSYRHGRHHWWGRVGRSLNGMITMQWSSLRKRLNCRLLL